VRKGRKEKVVCAQLSSDFNLVHTASLALSNLYNKHLMHIPEITCFLPSSNDSRACKEKHKC